MITYYEHEDIAKFHETVIRQIDAERNSWKQKIQKTNEHARGVASGLKLARDIFEVEMGRIGGEQ